VLLFCEVAQISALDINIATAVAANWCLVLIDEYIYMNYYGDFLGEKIKWVVNSGEHGARWN
jgi:hypothetical protein